MKKILSVIIVLSVILSVCGVFSYAADEKVIFSDSFENDLSKWVMGNDYAKQGNAVLSSDTASDGKCSIYIKDESDAATPNVYSPFIPAKPGHSYTVSGDFKHDKGANVRIYVRFTDSGNKDISGAGGSVNVASTTWKSASSTFVAPEGTVNIRIRIAGVVKSLGNGYVDNIKIIESTAAPQETPSTEQTTAAPSNADIPLKESFEDGFGAWKYNEQYSTISTDKATDGKKSVYIEDNSESEGPGITSPYVEILPKTKYTAYADYLDADGTIKIYIQYFDANKKRLSSNSSGTKKGNYTGKVSAESQENAKYACVLVVGNSTSTGKAYIDNVRLEKTVEATGTSTQSEQKNLSEIDAKLSAAKPGDIIVIPNGTYKDINLKINAKGTADKPIILKAETPGEVKFTGNTVVTINGEYIVLEGMLFEKCSGNYIVVFDALSKYCQLKECAILNSDPIDETGKMRVGDLQRWVFIRGEHNRVTSCYFRGKSASGVLLEIIRKSSNPDYHVVENCYFGDYKDGNVNGRETIRIGTSGESLSASYSTVTGCFFEECNGEGETISVKSCNNYVTNNTLYNNQGSFVLRHGNGTQVSGNLVISGAKSNRHNGIRVIGEDHKIFNNYFYNTPFNYPALYLSDGNPNPLIHEYLEVKNVEVYNNTFINNDIAIVAGEATPNATNNGQNKIIPPAGKIYNNAIISYKGVNPLITGDVNAKEIVFENNYAFGKEINYEGGLPKGINNEEFKYTIKDNFLVPENSDIGADIEDVKKAPTSPFDVMPSWVKTKFYDTGIIKFNVVENDPFNNSESKIEDLFAVDGTISVYLNGSKLKFDVNPQIINSRTMVPMRAIFEKFDAEVQWDEKTSSATAKNYKTTIKITNNSDVAYVNDKEFKLDSPATIIDGRFLVPIRFISESFGATVGWVDSTKTVLIDYEDRDFVGKTVIPAHSYLDNVLPVATALQSGDDGSASIKYIFDGNFETKWAVKEDAEGNKGYGILDFGELKTLDKVYIAFQKHASRVYTYEIMVSEDGVNYKNAVSKTSSNNFDGQFMIHELKDIKARYVKYVGYGNSENGWNNISELVITGK